MNRHFLPIQKKVPLSQWLQRCVTNTWSWKEACRRPMWPSDLGPDEILELRHVAVQWWECYPWGKGQQARWGPQWFLIQPHPNWSSLPIAPAIPFKHLHSTRISSLNISLLSRLRLLFPFLCLGSLSQHKFLSMVWNNSVLALNLSIPLKKRKAQ